MDAVCGNDAALRRRIEGLLAEHLQESGSVAASGGTEVTQDLREIPELPRNLE